jgi:hypothetical protein
MGGNPCEIKDLFKIKFCLFCFCFCSNKEVFKDLTKWGEDKVKLLELFIEILPIEVLALSFILLSIGISH